MSALLNCVCRSCECVNYPDLVEFLTSRKKKDARTKTGINRALPRLYYDMQKIYIYLRAVADERKIDDFV